MQGGLGQSSPGFVPSPEVTVVRATLGKLLNCFRLLFSVFRMKPLLHTPDSEGRWGSLCRRVSRKGPGQHQEAGPHCLFYWVSSPAALVAAC